MLTSVIGFSFPMRKRALAVVVILVVAGPALLLSRAAGPSPEELDRLMAPVALYPDQLLAQMLLCTSNPAKVAALHEWLASQQHIKGTELQDAAVVAGFDPSFVALAVFPQVVEWMAAQPDWVKRVGAAFTADRSAVFASIQRLRKKAHDAGALKTTPQQEVQTTTTASGQQVIVIEPANPQVVYVPQYNSTVVYTQPASSGATVAAGVIGFTAGIAIGAAIDNDYYYGPYGWRGGVRMYDDAWDDWYDAREDAREDWMDHREDLVESRGDRARTTQEQRTERQQTRQETRPQSQSAESRGHSRPAERTTTDRTGTRSDAFSGYASGRSERAASERGQRSRSSSARSSGGRRR